MTTRSGLQSVCVPPSPLDKPLRAARPRLPSLRAAARPAAGCTPSLCLPCRGGPPTPRRVASGRLLRQRPKDWQLSPNSLESP